VHGGKNPAGDVEAGGIIMWRERTYPNDSKSGVTVGHL
jgi:hypothetical protein